MRLRDSFDPFRHPAFSIAAFAVLLAILAEAMAGSYMALLAVERVHMRPLELTVFLTLSAISSIGVTTLFGRWHDKTPRLRPLILCVLAGVLGYVLCGVLTAPWMLMAVGFLLLGLASSSYPLLFAIAKGCLNGTGGTTESRGMAALRMLASLGWAIGPAIGAGLVGIGSFEGVFFGAAGCSLAALFAILVGRLKAAPLKIDARESTGVANWRPLWPIIVALALFNTAMFMGSNALSIVTVTDLKGADTDVGLLFSLCAALEVVVMGAFVIWPAKGTRRLLLMVGFLLFAAYFIAPILLPSLPTLYWAQVLRALAIGIVSVTGMHYVQNAMPHHAGTAAALFSNTVNAGWLLSGLGSGSWAHAFGYWSIFGLCVVLALSGAILVPLGRPPARRGLFHLPP